VRSAGAFVSYLLDVKPLSVKSFGVPQIFRYPLHILAKRQTRQALMRQSLPGLLSFSAVKLRIKRCFHNECRPPSITCGISIMYNANCGKFYAKSLALLYLIGYTDIPNGN
jgi:hypothetical protein